MRKVGGSGKIAATFLSLAITRCTTGGHGNLDGGAPDSVVDATALSPDILFGRKLVLWLDAAQASTLSLNSDGGVASWTDRVNASRAVKASPPWANNIQLELSAANGRPAVRVGISNGVLESNNVAAPDLVCDFVIAIVASFSNSSEGILFQQGDLGAGVFILSKANGAVFSGFSSLGATSPGPWNDNKFHAFGMQCAIQGSNNLVTVRAHGTEMSMSGPQSGPSQTAFTIGGEYCRSCEAGAPVTRSLEGRVAEVVIAINTSGTKEEIAAIDAYFRNKYGIPF